MSVHSNLIKSLLFFGMAIGSFSAYAVVENCTHGVSFNNGNTYKKLTGTVNCVWRKNPRVKTRSVSLRNGKKHGKSIIYIGRYGKRGSERNHISMVENYHNGKKHGKFIIYDEKNPSKINVEKDYKNGLQQREMRLSVFNGGKTISYYAPKGKWSSKIGSLSYNKAGQLSNKTCPKTKSHVAELNKVCGFSGSGQAVTLRDDNGKITTTAVIKQGQTQERKTFYKSGKLRTKAKPNLKQFFYENGKLEEEIIGNPKNILAVKKYYPSGVKKNLQRTNKRMITEERSWYMNGKPDLIAIHDLKKKVITIKRYYGNGHLKEDYRKILNFNAYNGYSYREKRIGTYRSFHENGKPYIEAVYDNKAKYLRGKRFFETGRLQESVVVNADKSRSVKQYDKNGTLEKSASYYPDGSVK